MSTAKLEYDLFHKVVSDYRREELIPLLCELKGMKDDIDVQLDGYEINGPRGNQDSAWFERTKYARNFTVKKIRLVESLLSAKNKMGGYIMWIRQREEDEVSWEGWVAIQEHPVEWLTRKFHELLEADLPTNSVEIRFFAALSEEQYAGLPPSISKHSVN